MYLFPPSGMQTHSLIGVALAEAYRESLALNNHGSIRMGWAVL